MATESAGQGKDMDEDKKGVPIKFQLSDVILKWNDKVAACKLRMPSVLLPSSEDPTVVFELVLDPDDWHSFKMMKEIVHPSILHLRAVLENGTDYWGLVEPHTGILYDYLKTGLGMPSSMKTVEVVLPTDMLRTIVKQILDGLEYLMYRGRYHGNFSLKSTYYHRRPNGIICAKLTGFKEKDQKNSLCQTQDVLALGQALDVVSSIAVDYNNKAAVIKKKRPKV
ncbi:hypothetical protein QOZ80_5AG0403590 [Eleusine coracana subsp. coracana]|nr:hypothetical protein QOZ80_5AG0403590 [Eleusine coracana subsp. coracana]